MDVVALDILDLPIPRPLPSKYRFANLAAISAASSALRSRSQMLRQLKRPDHIHIPSPNGTEPWPPPARRQTRAHSAPPSCGSRRSLSPPTGRMRAHSKPVAVRRT